MFFFFFFQAEDGIRDSTVTGVQTCALPILKSATSPAPSHGMEPESQPVSRTRNSAAATPIAAIAAVYIPTLSTQPTTNPARGPNASPTYTYLPPALGCRVASSAKHSAPRNASAPPSTQATNVSQGRPSWAATRSEEHTSEL